MSCTISDFQYAYFMVGPTGPTTSMFQIHCQNPTIFTTENFCIGNNTNGYPVHAWNMWTRYQNVGCGWFDNRLNHWNAQLLNMNPNPGNQQGYAHYQHKQAKIAQFEYLKVTCGCGPPIAPNNKAKTKKQRTTDIKKKINKVQFDDSILDSIGESRSINIYGDSFSAVDIVVVDSDGKYYNFKTKSFTTQEHSLRGLTLSKGSASVIVNFPTVSSDINYTITVLASSKHNTVYNSSISRSLSYSKKLYQYTKNTLTFQMGSILGVSAFAGFDGTTNNFTVDVTKHKDSVKYPFKIIGTAAATRPFYILNNPTESMIVTKENRTIGSASVGIKTRDGRVVQLYKWPVNNIVGLRSGMKVVGTNVTAGTEISNYEDISYSQDKQNKKITKVSEASTQATAVPTITDERITTQAGNIVFNKAQPVGLADDTVGVYAYGGDNIKSLTGYDIKVTNVKATITKPTTTTTEVSAGGSSADIAVSDREGVINNVSRVSGIGINPALQNPLITSGGGADGAGDWTMDAAQTLENGVTLTVENTGNIITITGDIEIKKVGESDVLIVLDIQQFLATS